MSTPTIDTDVLTQHEAVQDLDTQIKVATERRGQLLLELRRSNRWNRRKVATGLGITPESLDRLLREARKREAGR